MSGDARRAEPDVIDGVLTKLLYELSLRPRHQAKLIARGLPADEIARKRYVSAPETHSERGRVADALAPYLDDFGGGVPGFYRDGGRWQMVYRPSGFFIRVRDERGRVQALAQRVDEPRDGGKYIWLSSSGIEGGASTGAPAHFCNRHLMRDAHGILITEGSLKAEIVAYLSNAPVVGVAGTHAIAGLSERLRANFPKLRRAILAYDKDMIEKPQVLAAVNRLTAQLESAGFLVRVWTWEGPEKGYDDYLLSQLCGQGVRAT